MQHRSSKLRALLRALGWVGAVAATGAATTATVSAASRPTSDVTTISAAAPTRAASADLAVLDSLVGLSRKLRAHFVNPSDAFAPALARLFGDSALRQPGVYSLSDTGFGRQFSIITLRPFADKVRGRIGSYRIGFWPYEFRNPRSEAYGNPDGFIEVTPDNQETQVSEHFRLRDFLTKDQFAVWPKYLVLEERLLDKLELVIDELNRSGVQVSRIAVMSGFRTPQYNVRGVGEGGRAKASRHQYGDAADVFVDNDGDGWMDDLDRNGRIDHRDARVLLRAAERVEAAYPELVGGMGTYRATRAHGPFVHIDVRGDRARWGKV